MPMAGGAPYLHIANSLGGRLPVCQFQINLFLWQSGLVEQYQVVVLPGDGL